MHNLLHYYVIADLLFHVERIQVTNKSAHHVLIFLFLSIAFFQLS